MKHLLSCLFVIALSVSLFGEIIPEAIPEPVELQYTSFVQRLQSIPDHASRVEFLRQDKAKEQSGFFRPEKPSWADDVYRHFRAHALTFKWKCTEGETGPFTVELSETPDFTEVISYVAYKDWSKGTWYPYFKLEAYHNFLKIGTKYYWRVACYEYGHKENPPVYSAVSTFTTQDLPPRQIWLERTGTVNFRDLGGWKTLDGRRIRQGLAYRNAAFGDTSQDGIHPGRLRIGLADREFIVNTLKVKTEIELRGTLETAGATQSPLGETVKYCPAPVPAYDGAFSADGKAKYGAVFHLLAQRENYPLLFHCVGGADRTGTLAILVNGLLGVSRHDLEYDWECTFLPELPCLTKNCQSRCCSLVFNALDKYGAPEDTLARKIELYLQECGVTPEEIQTIRDIMLE